MFIYKQIPWHYLVLPYLFSVCSRSYTGSNHKISPQCKGLLCSTALCSNHWNNVVGWNKKSLSKQDTKKCQLELENMSRKVYPQILNNLLSYLFLPICMYKWSLVKIYDCTFYLKQFTLFKTELNVKCDIWRTDRKGQKMEMTDTVSKI